jgi:hypothetical protein
MTQKDDSIVLTCSCSSIGHVVRFERSYGINGDCDCYLHVSIDTNQSLWARIKTAWDLIWNRSPCRYICASEVLIEADDIVKIREWCNRSETALESQAWMSEPKNES